MSKIILNGHNIPTLGEQIHNITRRAKANFLDTVRRYKSDLADEIDRIVTGRQLAASLAGEGIEVMTSDWGEPCRYLYVELGDGHSTAKNRKRVEESLAKIAKACMSHLQQDCMEPIELPKGPPKEVLVTLSVAKFSQVKVTYRIKLKPDDPDAKCRIVKNVTKAATRVSYSVQCQMPQKG